MKRSFCLFFTATLFLSFTACSQKQESSNQVPTITPTIMAAEDPLPTVEPSIVPTTDPIENLPTLSPEAAPSVTIEPTKEPVPTVTPTITLEPTAIPKPTKAPKPTKTPIATVAPTSTPKPTVIPKPTKAPKPTSTPVPEVSKQSLTELMDTILSGIEELPMVGNTEVEENNFSYFLFIDAIKGAKALASDAMIRITPHSVVLLQVPEGTDVASVATEIEENANPAKWICAIAEKVTVTYKNNLILLVMSSEELTDSIVANFEALP